MAAAAVVRELRAIGVRLELRDGRIRALGAVDALTPELTDRIRAHAADIAGRLRTSRLVGGPVTARSSSSDGTPTAREWAAYFTRFPDELARLATIGSRYARGVPSRPGGPRTTAVDWAMWFAANPAELESGGPEQAGAATPASLAEGVR